MAFKDIPAGWMEVYAAIVGAMPAQTQIDYIGTERLQKAAELADRALAVAHAHWAARDGAHDPATCDARGIEERSRENHLAYLARKAAKEAALRAAGTDPDDVRRQLNARGIDPTTEDL